MLPPVKVSLNMPERVGMFIMLENKKFGDHRLMYLLKMAKEALKTKEKEIEEYGITPRPGGGINWNVEKGKKAKTFQIPALIYQMVEDDLKAMDKAQQISEDLVDLANKILGEPEHDGSAKPKKR